MQPIAENVALLPLMFVVYDLQPWISGTVYLSQCWSLSLEWYFYMALPLLLASRTRFSLAYGASISIAAAAALNVVNPYRHGYHLLPGVLFIFLIGSIIYQECQQTGVPRRTLFSFCCVLLLGIATNWNRSLTFEWTREVLLGLLAGIPLVYLLGRGRPDRLDDALGSLSYGVFLNHYAILGPIYHFKLLKVPWAIFGVTLGVSIPLAWFSFRVVELPFVRLRRALRRRRTAASRELVRTELEV